MLAKFFKELNNSGSCSGASSGSGGRSRKSSNCFFSIKISSIPRSIFLMKAVMSAASSFLPNCLCVNILTISLSGNSPVVTSRERNQLRIGWAILLLNWAATVRKRALGRVLSANAWPSDLNFPPRSISSPVRSNNINSRTFGVTNNHSASTRSSVTSKP